MAGVEDKSKTETPHQDILKTIERVERKLDRLENQNIELQLLLRVLVEPILSSSLGEVFKSPKHLYAYELSDGERSTRDIGSLVKLDQKGISNWWREWEEEGLMEKIGKRGQFKARYSLLELLVVYLPTKKQKTSKDMQDG